MDNNERNRLIAIKAALVTTTKTPGWAYFKQMANNVVQKAVQESLDEEDREKGESKRLKAKAMQKGFTELFNAVEVTKAYDPEGGSDDSAFGELELETSEHMR
jgi:hypothetical protein